jgi:leader peptidase (prepilin peptidase) / N-methyltransferase
VSTGNGGFVARLVSLASHWGGWAGHDCTNDRAFMLTTTTQSTRTITLRVGAGTVAAAFAALLGVVVIAIRLPPMSLAVLAALIPLGAAALVDAVEHRLPNHLVLLSAAPVSIVCVLDPFVARITADGGVAAGALLLAVPILALHLIAPASMGFGDVKAAVSLGATLGLIQPELSLWTLCLASAITGAWGIARRQRHVALGPGLIVAAMTVLVVGASTGIQVAAWR